MIEEKYPHIVPLIKRAGNDISKHRKMFTQRLENRPDYLEEWIKYLCEVDIKEAALATCELNGSNSYYQMLVSEAIDNCNDNYQKILSLLYLNKENEIINIINTYKVEKKKNENIEEYEEYDEEYTEESTLDEEDTYIPSEKLNEINKKIMIHLLDESNYNLILNYFYLLSSSDHKESMAPIFFYVNKLIINDKNKEKIEKIVNKLLEKKQYILTLQFLKILNVKDYSEYTKIDNKTYRELILGKFDDKKALVFGKELYLQDNHSLYDWYKYLNEKPMNTELGYHILKVIIKLILDTNEFKEEYKVEINKLNNYINFYKIKYVDIELTDLYTKLYNLIIEKEPLEIINAINLFDSCSPFKYDLGQKSIIYLRVFNRLNCYTETMKVIKNITDNRLLTLEEKVDIYMNSHFKILINISDYLKLILKHDDESSTKQDIKKLFDGYIFYGRVITINPKTKKVRIKIINVNENNKLRNSCTTMEKFFGCRINVGYTVQMELENYLPYDNSFEVSFVKSFDNIYLEKRKLYENLYDKLINNIEITDEDIKNMPKGSDINYTASSETERLFDMQYKALSNIKDNYKSFIKLIKKDTVSQFIWPSKGSEAIETNTTIMMEKRFKNYTKDLTIRSNFYNSIKSLIEESDASLEEIIYIYMNTAYKFIISINDFLRLLIYNERISEEEIINISEYFNNYEFYGKVVNDEDDENIILHTHLLWSFKITTNNKNILGSKRYIKFRLKEFDHRNNKFTTYNLKMSHHYIYDQQLGYLNTILAMIRRNGFENETYDKLMNMKPVEILKEDIIVTNNTELDQISNYVFNYNKIFVKHLNNEPKLYRFLQSLDENNLFKYPRFIAKKSYENIRTMSGFSFSIDKFKETFIKSKKLNIVMYCYLNSYYRTFINLDTLLQGYALNRNLINKEIDLSNVESTLRYVYINPDQTEHKWRISGIKHNLKLVINDELDENYVYTLKMLKYHSGTNELYLKVIKKELKKKKED